MASILRTEYGLQPKLVPLEEVIQLDENDKVIRRHIDSRFYDVDNYQMSCAGIGYFRPIFGDLPMPFYQP